MNKNLIALTALLIFGAAAVLAIVSDSCETEATGSEDRPEWEVLMDRYPTADFDFSDEI